MTPEDFSYFQSRVTRFISGSSSGIKFGSSVTPRYTKLSNIIPRRALPQQVLERIQRKTTSDVDDIETSSRGISALGKVTLNLEQTKNNLEKIFQVIADDYKSSKEQNKKEIDEYRKRVANRGRVLGKRELGDRKTDVLGTVKKYVGSFFSGTGGAIRSLAMFNLLQGILSGDPSKIIGPLLGIGLTYIPNIIGSVIGGVVGSVGTALAGRMFGVGAARAAAPAAGAPRLGSLPRLGGKAALLGGGIALASSMFNRPQESGTQRLEQLTEQQKSLTATSTLLPLPQDELKRFDNLNKKFEEALDLLLKKQKDGGAPQGMGRGGSGTSGAPTPQNVTATGQTINSSGGISYYGTPDDGFGYEPGKSTTASGERFDPNALTAAHKTLPFGTLLRVTNKDNNKSVVVRVNDRGPFVGDRVLDLSAGAMRAIGGIGAGVLTNTSIEVVQAAPSSRGAQPTPQPRPAAPRPPATATPNVTVLPVPVNAGSQQQTSAASPGNSIVPPIDTTYPENFLALYSKLIYQIV